MTDRKPDILTSWKIKQNTDGSYTAKCPAMPNVELTAENVVTILSKIERCLKSMYPDNSTVDGGISCINAEYSVTKRQEMSLDSFEMPSDDPTPEPATDAPELHEVQRTCENCGKITYCPKHNESSDFIAPENCDDFQLATRFVEPIEQKKPRKSRAKKAVKAPVEEPLIQAPKKTTKKTGKIQGDDETAEYEAKVQEHIENNKGYVWKRIKTLEDTCGNCIKCGADCKGNPRGEPCENYNACNNSSEQCVKCEHMSRGYGNTGFCVLHNNNVCHDDYACKSFVLSDKIKEWSKEE